MNDLRTIREQKGYSQQTLADLAGVRQGKISDLERGKVFPNSLTRQKIETVLLCKVDWFVNSKFRMRSPSFHKAENQIKKLIEIKIGLPVEEQRELSKIIKEYFN